MSSSSHPDCDVTSPHAIHVSTVPSHAWLQTEPFPGRTAFPLRSLKTMVFLPRPAVMLSCPCSIRRSSRSLDVTPRLVHNVRSLRHGTTVYL